LFQEHRRLSQEPRPKRQFEQATKANLQPLPKQDDQDEAPLTRQAPVAPLTAQKSKIITRMSASGCPHQHDIKPSNEGSMNPNNAMPADLHKQLPSPGQTRPLSTERVVSTIPKKDGSKWEYPSPQMFYNAMKRKASQNKDQEKKKKKCV
jgi:cytochrome c heme-lyase